MYNKRLILAILAVFSAFVPGNALSAINTRAIERVQKKAVLAASDFQVIDDFVALAVQEIVETEDFTSIARTRAIILQRANSDQGQYVKQFTKSLRKYLPQAFVQAAEFEDKVRDFRVTLNLLILLDKLENLQLANMAIEKLSDSRAAIRYVAVHALTNSGIQNAINSNGTASEKAAVRITAELKKFTKGASPGMLILITRFAAGVETKDAQDMLKDITQMRIDQYADWTVQNEMIDCIILRLLCGKLASATRPDPQLGRSFAQLFSYAVQRYVKGADVLTEAQKRDLTAVMVEAEDKCVLKIFERPQRTIRRALERDDLFALLAEHDRLLGDETTQGLVPIKLDFNYGNSANTGERIAPLKLSDPTTEIDN
ncbi:hypothetical protein ACFL3G_10415 [Planctomycetota bacterium]